LKGHPAEGKALREIGGFRLSGGVLSSRDVIVEAIEDFDWITTVGAGLGDDGVNWRLALIFAGEDNLMPPSPAERPHPMIEISRHILFLPRLAVVQHQPEAVALVSRTLLGAVGDVLAIGRIERSRVAGGMVGGDVLGRSAIYRDDPEIVVRGRGFDLVVIRGVANLLPVGREGVVVLSAEREYGRVVVAGGEVQRGSIDQTGNCCWINLGRSFDYENVAALSSLVGVPMPIEQSVEDDGFDFRFFGFFRLLGVAGFFCGGRPVALGIHI